MFWRVIYSRKVKTEKLKYSAKLIWKKKEDSIKSMKVKNLICFHHWLILILTPITWRILEYTICSIVFQWCNAWSCRIRNFKSQSFTAGKWWLEENTCATIEIVKLFSDIRIPKLGKGIFERKLNKVVAI